MPYHFKLPGKRCLARALRAPGRTSGSKVATTFYAGSTSSGHLPGELDDRDEGDRLGVSRLYYRMAPWKLVTHKHPDRWRYDCRVLREEPGGRTFIEPLVAFPRRDVPVLEGLLAEAVTIYRGDEDTGSR